MFDVFGKSVDDAVDFLLRFLGIPEVSAEGEDENGSEDENVASVHRFGASWKVKPLRYSVSGRVAIIG